jgi:methionine-gamma-lyase
MAVIALTEPGDQILVGGTLYGGTTTMLRNLEKKFKVRVHTTDTSKAANVADAAARVPDLSLVLIETPDNPTLNVTDIRAVAAITEPRGIPLLVDNTFSTPYLQQPMRLGTDIAIQSMTKYVSGHSACIGGVVVGPAAFIQKNLYPLFRDFGAVPSPFDSWLNSLTLQTMGRRLDIQCSNAAMIAAFLEKHPRVARVHYPGLESHPQREVAKKQMVSGGAMIAFELRDGFEPAQKLMDYFARRDTPMELAVSLGAVISYIEHPASMTHAGVPKEERLKGGVTDDLVRLSVGIEGISTLIQALEEGLEIAYSGASTP